MKTRINIEARDCFKVGDYVEYIPDLVILASGKWRVLGKNNDEILLAAPDSCRDQIGVECNKCNIDLISQIECACEDSYSNHKVRINANNLTLQELKKIEVEVSKKKDYYLINCDDITRKILLNNNRNRNFIFNNKDILIRDDFWDRPYVGFNIETIGIRFKIGNKIRKSSLIVVDDRLIVNANMAESVNGLLISPTVRKMQRPQLGELDPCDFSDLRGTFPRPTFDIHNFAVMQSYPRIVLKSKYVVVTDGDGTKKNPWKFEYYSKE